MKWRLLAAALAVLGLAALMLFTGFADVPCQDGVWDPGKGKCLPY